MAVLEYTPVNVHPEATMKYILNHDKIIPGGDFDIYRVMNYMGDEESTERVYAFGHNCSANPTLCEEQFALYRQRYYAFKGGAGVQGCSKDGNSEILALHFFLSYDEQDNVTPEIMNEISRRLISETKMKDFPNLTANHFNTKHKHTHILNGQYSAVGKPRKFAMKQREFDDLRRKANRLCVEYGLSVIDLPILRMDREYSDWLDRVIAEGKVRVLEANGAGYSHKTSRKGSYYNWKKAKEAEERSHMTEKQFYAKKNAEQYVNAIAGRRYPVSSTKGKHIYVAAIRDRDGRKRSSLELLFILAMTIYKGECDYYTNTDTKTARMMRDTPIYGRRDWEVQSMLDCITAARVHSVGNPNEVQERLKEIGGKMNAIKADLARQNDFLATATDVGSDRYKFAKRKVAEYEERLKELNKSYRDLKKLQAQLNRPVHLVNELYEQRSIVEQQVLAERGKKRNLSDIISDAEEKKNKSLGDILNKNEVIK